ncbi:MAG: translation initiation factor IF-2 N-terminal domain-containing protein [Planctomycetes bacterium]|nr:translation initiation factor IF-2 N-terminal domain-containing protein [Planctomycetota bacterium]
MAIRVFKLAKELGVTSEEIMAEALNHGIECHNHMGSLSESQANLIRAFLIAAPSADADEDDRPIIPGDLERQRAELKFSRYLQGGPPGDDAEAVRADPEIKRRLPPSKRRAEEDAGAESDARDRASAPRETLSGPRGSTRVEPGSSRREEDARGSRGDNETLSGARGQTRLGTAPPTARADAFEPGTLFHQRYRIESLIGEGGMGRVYLAQDRGSRESICLKVIRPEFLADQDFVERLLREGRLARSLRHSGIVAVHDVYAADDACYLTMEYIEGRTLRDWLDERQQAGEAVPLAVASGITRRLLEALEVAHAAEVIHRDLKPENVMLLGEPLAGDYRSKLMDFGIARKIESETRLTRLGSPIGTEGYMAPEQAGRGLEIGPWTDVYAVTAMFYEMLCDLPPSGRWDLPSEIDEDLPGWVDELVTQGLKRHPRRRLGSVRAFMAALDAAEGPAAKGRGGSGIEVPDPEPAAPTLIIPDWAEAIPGDPWSNEAGDQGFARAVRHRQSGIELLLVPAGTYRRGAQAGDDKAWDQEKPEHEVTISRPYYLGRYPVTQGEWWRLTRSKPSKNQGDRHPVESVSWYTVDRALQSAGLRLPTEAEWEHACRAGTASYSREEIERIAWWAGNAEESTQPVGLKPANAWGFHDMQGNVLEWCADWFDKTEYERYRSSVAIDPKGPLNGDRRVARGGSAGSTWRECRATHRGGHPPDDGSCYRGFRVARTP